MARRLLVPISFLTLLFTTSCAGSNLTYLIDTNGSYSSDFYTDKYYIETDTQRVVLRGYQDSVSVKPNAEIKIPLKNVDKIVHQRSNEVVWPIPNQPRPEPDISKDWSSVDDGYILESKNPDTSWELYYSLWGKPGIIRVNSNSFSIEGGLVGLAGDYWEFIGDRETIKWQLHIDKKGNSKWEAIILASKMVRLK